jgi:hypothetical protein
MLLFTCAQILYLIINATFTKPFNQLLLLSNHVISVYLCFLALYLSYIYITFKTYSHWPFCSDCEACLFSYYYKTAGLSLFATLLPAAALLLIAFIASAAV